VVTLIVFAALAAENTAIAARIASEVNSPWYKRFMRFSSR
jgi:hypothetical protein